MKTLLLMLLLFNGIICMAQSEINWAGNFTISFEQSYEKEYYLIDTNEVWQVCHPQKQVLFFPDYKPYLGTRAIITDSIGYYSSNLKSSFQFRLLLGPGVETYWMSFEHKYDFETMVDGGIIETSYDNGVIWNNILSDTLIQNNLVRSSNFYTVNDKIESYNNQPGFTGIQDTMKMVLLEFKAKSWMMNKSILIRFTISTDSNENSNEGWMMDEIGFGGVFVGIEERPELDFTCTFPNPVQNILNIRCNTGSIKTIEVLNAHGEVVHEYSIPINQINVSNYIPGIYFLLYTSQSGDKWISKFVKN